MSMNRQLAVIVGQIRPQKKDMFYNYILRVWIVNYGGHKCSKPHIHIWRAVDRENKKWNKPENQTAGAPIDKSIYVIFRSISNKGTSQNKMLGS